MLLTLVLILGLTPVDPVDPLEATRARLVAAPEDGAGRCDFAFSLVKAGRMADARQWATEGLVLLARASAARPHRALAPCLYTRGRAHEGLGDRPAAITDWVASLALRPNPTVAERLVALVPDLPPQLPIVALAAGELTSAAPLVVEAGRTTWYLVQTRTPSGSGFSLKLHAITQPPASAWITYARDGRLPPVEVLAEWTQEEVDATFTVSADPLPALARQAGLQVDLRASGGGACGQMEGFATFEFQAIAFVARRPDHTLAAELFTIRRDDCSGSESAEIEVGDRHITVKNVRGGGQAPGRRSLVSILE
jgi:hypothetical protein